MAIVLAPQRARKRRGYARGEETRSRIVAAALRIFGEHGFDQASTRLIATAAAVKPPALQYYFGGKEGLHRACAQFIIDHAMGILSPALAQASRAIGTRSRGEALTALYGLIDALAVGLADSGAESWRRFIARGKADGAGPAMPMIRDRIGLPLIEVTTRLVGFALGQAQDVERNRLRALALLAPCNWIHANRDNTLALMGWSDIDPQRLELIRQVVREQAAGTLGDIPPSRARKRAAPSLRRRRQSRSS
jgi:TetR/AcrR family transcriptional regulator, regulator of cefoperazone and chloramphenicol sensitivity